MRPEGGRRPPACGALALGVRALAAVALAGLLAAGLAWAPAAVDADQARGRLPRAPLEPGGELEPFPEIPEEASVEEALAILKDRLERVHRVFRGEAGAR